MADGMGVALTAAQARDFRAIARGGLWQLFVPRVRKLLNVLCAASLMERTRREPGLVLEWTFTPVGRAWLAANPEVAP